MPKNETPPTKDQLELADKSYQQPPISPRLSPTFSEDEPQIVRRGFREQIKILLDEVDIITFDNSIDSLPEIAKEVIKNPSPEWLRETMYQHGADRTNTAATAVESEEKKRVPPKKTLQETIERADYFTVQRILEQEMQHKRLIQMDRTIMDGRFTVRIITTDQLRGPQLAYGAHMIFKEGKEGQADLPNDEIDFIIFYTPGRREKALPLLSNENGRSIIIGSGYHGQTWKTILENLSYRLKMENKGKSIEEQEIAKHIALRTFIVFDKTTQEFYKIPAEISGLSGTGKTTLGVSSGDPKKGLIDNEKEIPPLPPIDQIKEIPKGYFSQTPSDPNNRVLVAAPVHQDDAAVLKGDGTVKGIVIGAYPKTEGLTDQGQYAQPEIYRALLKSNTGVMLENVFIRKNAQGENEADFLNTEKTANGRGLFRLSELENFGGIDAPAPLRISIQLTRRDTFPAVFKFSSVEQAEAAWTAGETVKTSAVLSLEEIQAARGQKIPTRSLQYHPFQDGDRGEDVATHYAINKNIDEQYKKEKKDPIQRVMLNTDRIGDSNTALDISPEITMKIMSAVAKGIIKWKPYPELGVFVPESIPGVDPRYFKPLDWYREQGRAADFYRDMQTLYQERQAYLNKFKIPDEVKRAVGYGEPTQAMRMPTNNNE